MRESFVVEMSLFLKIWQHCSCGCFAAYSSSPYLTLKASFFFYVSFVSFMHFALDCHSQVHYKEKEDSPPEDSRLSSFCLGLKNEIQSFGIQLLRNSKYNRGEYLRSIYLRLKFIEEKKPTYQVEYHHIDISGTTSSYPYLYVIWF